MRRLLDYLIRGPVDDLGSIHMTPWRLRAGDELKARYADPQLAIISRHAQRDHTDFWVSVDAEHFLQSVR